ncbi:MAG: phosphatidylglycerophosphatase A [Burkholderiales bacterium]|nr:phosphatidylglycerophosphatase A [Burkholderiales bacterium]
MSKATATTILPERVSAAAPCVTWSFVKRRAAHLLACGFGVGLFPGAPGTAGTLAALPLYWILDDRVTGADFLLLVALLFAAGVWACGATGRALGSADHGAMVWDEIVAFLLVLFFTPAGFAWVLSAFLLFRIFDVVKPWPIPYFERALPGGFGVMFDDLFAAFYTLLCLALIRLF